MKKLIFLAFILTACVPLGAKAAALLENDSNGRPVQAFVPDDSKSIMLTVVKQTVDMTNDLYWQLYSPTACKYRMMDTATVTGHNQYTSPADANTSRGRHRNFPFINFSGCTNGELQRQ